MIYEISNNEQEINWEASGDERILQNAKNLLRTYKGEIPFCRDIGISSEIEDLTSREAQNKILLEAKETIDNEDLDILDAKVEQAENGVKILVTVEMKDVY